MLANSGNTRSDDRSYDLHRFTKMPVNVLSTFWYPKLYSLHNIYESEEEVPPGGVNEETEKIKIPSNLACTDEKIDDGGIYLLDNCD